MASVSTDALPKLNSNENICRGINALSEDEIWRKYNNCYTGSWSIIINNPHVSKIFLLVTDRNKTHIRRGYWVRLCHFFINNFVNLLLTL